MKINWFTVIAQVINFIVLVWLLKKFLYKPILNAVNEREKKITGQLKDAEDKKAIAQKEQDDFKKKNLEFDREKKDLMDKAIAYADTEKDKLMAAAKTEANTLRSNMEKAAQEKQESNALAAAENTQQQVFTIAKKALSGMASISLEAQLVDTFIKRLKNLKEDEKNAFSEAFNTNENAVEVKSAFTLPAEKQSEIIDAVSELIGNKVSLQFKIATEIISGIALSTKGYKLAWTFAEYLNAMDKNVSETMKNAKPEPVNN